MNLISQYHHLNHLVDLFMAGETTPAQEKELFAAFAPGREVPPELEPLRSMMQWYGAGLQAPEAATARPATRRWTIATWASVAASVAMILTLSISMLSRQSNFDDDYSTYAGSYVIRDGVKSTNLAVILPEVKQVEQLVESQQQQVSRAVEAATTPVALDESIDMDDPLVADVINRVISNE